MAEQERRDAEAGGDPAAATHTSNMQVRARLSASRLAQEGSGISTAGRSA